MIRSNGHVEDRAAVLHAFHQRFALMIQEARERRLNGELYAKLSIKDGGLISYRVGSEEIHYPAKPA